MNSIRVIGGKWRGRNITLPNNSVIRPTPNRVRETLFNWLQPNIVGANCLDLFAGSGVLGVESLSRGASYIKFVDMNQDYLRSIRKSLELFGEEGSADFVCGDAMSSIGIGEDVFDIVFIDPPYHEDLLIPALETISNCKNVAKRALIYCEKHKKDNIIIPDNLQVMKHKQYASVEFFLLEKG